MEKWRRSWRSQSTSCNWPFPPSSGTLPPTLSLVHISPNSIKLHISGTAINLVLGKDSCTKCPVAGLWKCCELISNEPCCGRTRRAMQHTVNRYCIYYNRKKWQVAWSCMLLCAFSTKEDLQIPTLLLSKFSYPSALREWWVALLCGTVLLQCDLYS